MNPCPCGSGHDFDDCCGPILNGAPAATAEALMRARYSSYATNRTEPFISDTMAPEMREDFNPDEVEKFAKDVTWLGLTVRHVEGGGPEDQTGTVEYVARFRVRGGQQVHHELSSFRRDDGRWLYVDGEINPKAAPRQVVKIGRNDPCPCGSGKKYKKCCGTTATTA
ncbi:MAG: YchJ family protein [Alphaproteobacteria bacterium]|nr:YchJ family protein [Alphaproteobacteria bacterium]